MIEDLGTWLKGHRRELDRREADWLAALAEFDLAQGWYLDGSMSCASWLMWHAKLARATAFEKLRIAHELRRRPLLADAFSAGRVPYSAVRVMTRITDVDPDVDEALIAVAETGTIADVERAVRCYRLHAEQEREPSEPCHRRGLRVKRFGDGTARVEIILSEPEADEVAATLQALVDTDAPGESADPVDESPCGDSTTKDVGDPAAGGADEPVEPVDESPRGDFRVAYPDLPDPAERRADAFMDLISIARAHLLDGHAAGADRYLVHVIYVPGEPPSLLDGTPIHPNLADGVACDATVVTHRYNEAGEPLNLGRKTRTWTTAQRRAALIRDGGHCRFPGCTHRIADLHHQHYWAHGGSTNIDNGFLACRRHHRLLHSGYQAVGDPNHHLNFYRPDGLLIGTTTPTNRTAPIRRPAPVLTLVS